MSGKTHLVGGHVLGITILSVLSNYLTIIPINDTDLLLFLLGITVGSLAPDIDHRGSTAAKKTLYLPAYIVNRLFGHRGIIHSVFVGLVLAMILLPVSFWLAIGMFAGWLSHLALDWPTPAGLKCLFWPLRKLGR